MSSDFLISPLDFRSICPRYSRALRHLHLLMAVGVFGAVGTAQVAQYTEGQAGWLRTRRDFWGGGGGKMDIIINSDN